MFFGPLEDGFEVSAETGELIKLNEHGFTALAEKLKVGEGRAKVPQEEFFEVMNYFEKRSAEKTFNGTWTHRAF